LSYRKKRFKGESGREGEEEEEEEEGKSSLIPCTGDPVARRTIRSRRDFNFKFIFEG